MSRRGFNYFSKLIHLVKIKLLYLNYNLNALFSVSVCSHETNTDLVKIVVSVLARQEQEPCLEDAHRRADRRGVEILDLNLRNSILVN